MTRTPVFCMSGWEIRALAAGHKTWATRRAVPKVFGVWQNVWKPHKVGGVFLVGEVYAKRHTAMESLWHYRATKSTYVWNEARGEAVERFDGPTNRELKQAGGWRHPGSITEAEARWHIQITHVESCTLKDMGDLEALEEGYEGHPSQMRYGTLKEAGKPPRTQWWVDGSPMDGLRMDRRDRSHRNEDFDLMWRYQFEIVKGPNEIQNPRGVCEGAGGCGD